MAENNTEKTGDDSDITFWIEKLKEEESNPSIEIIWKKYYTQLINFARKKLGNVPRRQFDEEDIASSVLESFFEGVRQDRFPQLSDRTDLWKILLMLTTRKTAQNIRSQLAEKRGGGSVRGESVFDGSEDSGGGIDNCVSPTQKFAHDLTIEMKDRLSVLGDAKAQKVAVMKLQGYTNSEIADDLQVNVRTVERTLKSIREQWQADLD